MSQLTFLITSGPTREYIDPVRYITNDSSGKMGAALTREILKRKHKVILISGKTQIKPPKNAKVINVLTAKEMFEAVKKNFKSANIIIGTAAVSDFAPLVFSKNKIKKDKKIINIKFKQNPDIIAYCGKNKKNRVVVGFALETNNLKENSNKKFKEKNLDIIVANSNESLGKDNTSVQIIGKDKIINLKNTSKKVIAGKIINESIAIFKNIKTYQKNS